MKIRLHLALRARRGKVRLLSIAVVLGFGILAARAETKAFPPWQTWVFVAGLLEWQDNADSTAERFAAGSPVEIQWEAEWYPGRILEDDGGSYHVSYDGYGEDWNEWAEPKRVRRRSP